MITQELNYFDDDTECKGFIAYDETIEGPMPAVMIAHDWTGCADFTREKAKQLASLGYLGFAIDVYGEGKTGAVNDEKMALMMPFIDDREKLKTRLLSALEAMSALAQTDKTRLAAMGFCFGGLCALDLARAGADLRAIVSFHGALGAPNMTTVDTIDAKLLVLHGYADPMVPITDVQAFCEEMEKAGADWQMHMYGKTLHAFTNPQANDRDFGTLYDATADARSWQAMTCFFKECLISAD